eukprot:gene15801-58232_t
MRDWAGWSRGPIFVAAVQTEKMLRDLATRPRDWDCQAAAGEPDYSLVAEQR